MHTFLILGAFIAGLAGIALGIGPSVITWARRRRQTRTTR